MAVSGSGTPDTGCGTPFRPVPAEFYHWDWIRKVVGVTPSGPLKANSGVRSGVAAAGKVLEGDDQQIYVHYITITY